MMDRANAFGWQAAAVSVQGGTHIDLARPCEDFSMTFAGDGWLCAVVADGHGSRKHFRSGLGAEMACTAVRQTLESLSPKEAPQTIQSAIISAWRAQVRRHLADFPWTAQELDEQRALLDEDAFARLQSGESAEIAYGSTVIFAVVTDTGWLAMQLGDGGVALADHTGAFSFPMGEDGEQMGNYTASLAMSDPLQAFRHCAGTDLPALLALYTDGVEKAFPRRSLALTRCLHEAYSAAGDDQALTDCARRLAEHSGVRDDTSIALLMDASCCVPPPHETSEQRQLARQRLLASMQECEATLSYLQRVAAQQEAGSDVEADLLLMIERKQSELSAMKEALAEADKSM